MPKTSAHTLGLLVLPVFLTATLASATTLGVPVDYPTIQEAIDAAGDGDSVLVAMDTYTGEGNRDLVIEAIGLTVLSESGPEVTIIDCQAMEGDEHRGFKLTDGATVRIQGFTIQNGFVLSGAGSAIECLTSGLTLENCIIRDCRALDGDGVVRAASSTLDVRNTEFLDNEAFRAGALALIDSRPVTVTGSRFERNTCLDEGGAVRVEDSNASFADCLFRDNESGGHGGAVLCVLESACGFTGTEFLGNSASVVNTGFGGAVYSRAAFVTLSQCLVAGNTAYGAGGIYAILGSLDADGCLITGNRSSSFGGGLLLIAPGSVTNATIASNSADLGGGLAAAFTSLEKTILWSNCADTAGDEIYGFDFDGFFDVSLFCCAVDSSGIAVEDAEEFTLDGRQVFSDPHFCDPAACEDAPSEDGDYTVAANSPCLPENSPCGELIGAREEACDGPTPTVSKTWGQVKAAFGRRAGDLPEGR